MAGFLGKRTFATSLTLSVQALTLVGYLPSKFANYNFNNVFNAVTNQHRISKVPWVIPPN